MRKRMSEGYVNCLALPLHHALKRRASGSIASKGHASVAEPNKQEMSDRFMSSWILQYNWHEASNLKIYEWCVMQSLTESFICIRLNKDRLMNFWYFAMQAGLPKRMWKQRETEDAPALISCAASRKCSSFESWCCGLYRSYWMVASDSIASKGHVTVAEPKKQKMSDHLMSTWHFAIQFAWGFEPEELGEMCDAKFNKCIYLYSFK